MFGNSESHGVKITSRREILLNFPDGSIAAICGWPEDFASVCYVVHFVRGAIDSQAAAFVLDIEKRAHGDPGKFIENSKIITPGTEDAHREIFFWAMTAMREDWGAQNSDYGVNFEHYSLNRKPTAGNERSATDEH